MISDLHIGDKGAETMSGMEGNPGSEVEKVANVIADAGRRRDFAANPEGTLTDAGVDVDQLPDGVRSTLFGLSHEELDVVSRVKESLDQAGVSREDQAKIF
jgi:hypothetical protein